MATALLLDTHNSASQCIESDSLTHHDGVTMPSKESSMMGSNLGIRIAIAASLLLGACGSDIEESAGTRISAVELAERIQTDTPPFVLDVRTTQEFANGHVPGAVHIPHDELASRLEELPVERSEEIVVHCQSGRRASLAEATLREAGYSNVRDLEGHWQAWQGAGLPVE
jgi:rhodanese-related sulfurtransferase